METMNKLLVIAIISGLNFLTGCKDDGGSEELHVDQIDFKIVTMDKNENESINFETGEEFIMALKLINNSGMELNLDSYSLSCKLLQDTNFLFLNKKSITYINDSTFSPVGRPFQYPVNCLSISLPYYNLNIPTGETYVVGASWKSNPENEDLIPGQYFTEYILNFETEVESKIWHLRTDFEIK
jgi:hypothetical protein